MDRLECLFCKKKFDFNLFNPFCPECGEPMVMALSRQKRTIALDRSLCLEKFRAFLPLASVDRRLSLGEGNTPLVPLHRVREKYFLPLLLAKNETMNPTHSFKDRGTAVAIQKAVALSIKKVGTVSTGNMAASTAAYAAKAGLESFIFLKEGTSPQKILSTQIYGARVFKMKGDYGQLFRKSFVFGREKGIYFANSVDPLRIEGYKTIAYEIFLALGNKAPRFVFVPVSSGGNLIGIMKGFIDLKEEGLVRDWPIFVGVQAEGCSPITRAFKEGKEKYERVARAETIAHAISNPDPPAGNLVLKLIREMGGLLLDVTDKEILNAQKELAELEGIFADPASVTTLAAILKNRDKLPWPDSSAWRRLSGEVVLIITGSGLKHMTHKADRGKSNKPLFLGQKWHFRAKKRSRSLLSC